MLKDKRYTHFWVASRQSKEWLKRAEKYRKTCHISKAELTRIAIDYLILNVTPGEIVDLLRDYKYYNKN